VTTAIVDCAHARAAGAIIDHRSRDLQADLEQMIKNPFSPFSPAVTSPAEH